MDVIDSRRPLDRRLYTETQFYERSRLPEAERSADFIWGISNNAKWTLTIVSPRPKESMSGERLRSAMSHHGDPHRSDKAVGVRPPNISAPMKGSRYAVVPETRV
jgi:hypothetical protein